MSRKLQQANFAHWNRFQLLRFEQCLMLLLGFEPDQRIESRSIQDRYDHLWNLIESSRSAGILEGRYPYRQDIEPSKFIKWAKSMGEPIPEDWNPVVFGQAVAEQALIDANAMKVEEGSSSIESRIADNIYNRICDDPSILGVGGGTTIFDYLNRVGTLKLESGVEYFLKFDKTSSRDHRKDVGKRKYSGVTIGHNDSQKLEYFGFRKLVVEIELRKKQEKPQ